jgi:hypothetical protein
MLDRAMFSSQVYHQILLCKKKISIPSKCRHMYGVLNIDEIDNYFHSFVVLYETNVLNLISQYLDIFYQIQTKWYCAARWFGRRQLGRTKQGPDLSRVVWCVCVQTRRLGGVRGCLVQHVRLPPPPPKVQQWFWPPRSPHPPHLKATAKSCDGHSRLINQTVGINAVAAIDFSVANGGGEPNTS